MKRLLILGLSLSVLVACARPPAIERPLSMSSEDRAVASALDPDAEEAWDVAESTAQRTELLSPAPNGVSFGSPLRVDLMTSVPPEDLILMIDGREGPKLKTGEMPTQRVAFVEGLSPGWHTLTVLRRGNPVQLAEAGFNYQTGAVRDRLVAFADATVRRFDAERMGWDWGEGLLLYALVRLDEHLGTPRYRSFLTTYYDRYARQGLPSINWSDKCVPALGAYELYRATGNPVYREQAEAVVRYLKSARPTADGGLNHLGTTLMGKFYPQSMWVDSLMMYNVFAARWGRFEQDRWLSNFAAEQPSAFAEVLQSPNTKLWRHAWFVKRQVNKPKSEVYWLRGNGWAMASIPETLDMLPAGDPRKPVLQGVLSDTAKALLPYQSPMGLWYTVLNKPGRIYLETSGTALCAYGMLRGVHQGYLPESYRAPAESAVLALFDRLQQRPDGLSMPGISHKTMPYSFLGYSIIPQRNDLAFGVASLILAGMEYDRGTVRGR